MSQLAFANAATSTLAVSITNSATSLTVAPGTGSLFPAISTGQCFLATIFPATGSTPAPEVVLVSAVASNIFTVTRAQEGTSAQAWGVGSIISQLVTAGTMDLLLQSATYAGNPNGHVAGTQAATGIAPSVVWDSSDALFWVCTMTGTTTTAQWSALAPLNSPAFTGSPTATTQSQGDSSTKLATTAYVDTGLAAKAALAGSSGQVFSVANAVSGAEAVNLNQLNTKANLNGDSSQIFNVSPAVSLTEAMALGQLIVPQAIESSNGIYLGTNYNSAVAINMTAPCAGHIFAFGKINLSGPAATNQILTKLYVNGNQVSGDQTVDSQSHFGVYPVAAGAVYVQYGVSTASDPGVAATYSVGAFFLPV